ncbi:MAG TPA: VCBS repeat-containing protein [Verrucomicrobiales bacterium]|nr:VCBS repeat-containing protein [Verrucomicrobiales bacterium]
MKEFSISRRARLGIVAGLLAGAAATPVPAADPVFRAQTIDDKIAIGYGLVICDMDGDGAGDILLADQKEIVWYEAPDWKKHVIARNLTLRDNVCVAARDIDGDGKAEVAVGGNWNPSETSNETESGSVHYLIRPGDPRDRWESVRLPHEPAVHRMHWVRDGAGRFQLAVLPLHGRDNRDGDGENGARLFAYLPPEDPRQVDQWKRTLVDASMHMTHNFDVLTQAGGAEQMLVGGKEGALRVSIPAEGAAPKAEWLIQAGDSEGDCRGFGEIRYAPGADSGAERVVFAGIEPMHGDQLTLYAEDGKRSVLLATMNQGHALAWGAFSGPAARELVAGWRNPDPDGKVGIKVFSGGNAEAGGWNERWVDENGMACEDLQVADLNGDEKPDIVACGRATKNVVIYWNETP